MADDNNGGDKYDPEAERCCKDCGKTFKSKEGILHGKYDFHCSPCHMWWKATNRKIYIGGGILLVLILIIALAGFFKGTNKSEKKSKKRKFRLGDYTTDDDDDDD